MTILNAASKPNSGSTVVESFDENDALNGILFQLATSPPAALMEINRLQQQVDLYGKKVNQLVLTIPTEPRETYDDRRKTAMKDADNPDQRFRGACDGVLDVFFRFISTGEALQKKAVHKILSALPETTETVLKKAPLPVKIGPKDLISCRDLQSFAENLPDSPDRTTLLQLAEVGKAFDLQAHGESNGFSVASHIQTTVETATRPLWEIAEERSGIVEFGVSLDTLKTNAMEFERAVLESALRTAGGVLPVTDAVGQNSQSPDLPDRAQRVA
jgi:hypothetical protein